MALNKDEKELLMVVRYFNEHVENKKVARLVTKLSKDFTLDDVRALTGFSVNEINVLLASIKPKTRTQKVVAKLRDDADEAIEELDNMRLAIELNGESNLPTRVAYDATKLIEQEFKPGDMFLTTKAMAQKFSCAHKTVEEARRILVSHNWLERADERNKRLGYIVK